MPHIKEYLKLPSAYERRLNDSYKLNYKCYIVSLNKYRQIKDYRRIIYNKNCIFLLSLEEYPIGNLMGIRNYFQFIKNRKKKSWIVDTSHLKDDGVFIHLIRNVGYKLEYDEGTNFMNATFKFRHDFVADYLNEIVKIKDIELQKHTIRNFL